MHVTLNNLINKLNIKENDILVKQFVISLYYDHVDPLKLQNIQRELFVVKYVPFTGWFQCKNKN